MPIDHVGLGVPDVPAAQIYYDELMPKLGFQPCFGNGYCPVDWKGAQLFLYESKEESPYSRFRPGLHHLAFVVSTRGEVDAVHAWAQARGDEVLRTPQVIPQFGEDYYATYFLDPHGFRLEVVCLSAVEAAQ